VLTAFFLEASFLGIMLFGWKRVGSGLHFFSTCMVAIGTLISAFWILSANSWMQTPQGWTWAEDGAMIATNFAEVIFNPSLPTRLAHMVLAAFLTTAMVVAGASAFTLLKKKAIPESRTALRMAILMMAIVTPIQIMVGHESGIVAGHHQPAKVAALEGWWTTRTQQPTVLIGWPDEEAETNHFELAIPGFGSTVNNAGPDDVLPGLDQFAEQDRPPVWITFWAFRIMVGMGLIMLTLGLWGAVAWALKRLDAATWYHRALVLAAPSGFVAVLTGWITAEVGRQPYVVYGVLRTADAVSPVSAASVATSLLLFMVVYAIVFSAGALYILRLMAKGPESDEAAPQSNQPPGTPLAAAIEEAP
jgi:cytochrome d ubiquinol oxidase subunit I